MSGWAKLFWLIVLAVIVFFIFGALSSNSGADTTAAPDASQGALDTPTDTPEAPNLSGNQFTDGDHVVGTDIQPGTYRTRTPSAGCYWERQKNFSGNLSSILANDNTDDPAVVTIAASDKGFKTVDCGTWTDDLSAITSDQTSFGDGTFIVGTDIQPGTYQSSGESGCYWERESDFLGSGSDSILANDNTDTPAVVTIDATDQGFKSRNCGTWTKTG